MNKYNVTETSKDRFHVLSLEFSGYEYLDAEKFTIEVNTSFTITNTGTAETPVTLEITPLGGAVDIPDDQMEVSVLCDEDGAYFIDDDDAAIGSYDYDNLTIKGLCRDVRTGDDLDIVIRNITPEQKIIIDGETGLITEEGKANIPAGWVNTDMIEDHAVTAEKTDLTSVTDAMFSQVITNAQFADAYLQSPILSGANIDAASLTANGKDILKMIEDMAGLAADAERIKKLEESVQEIIKALSNAISVE